jgi:hypothetical protein
MELENCSIGVLPGTPCSFTITLRAALANALRNASTPFPVSEALSEKLPVFQVTLFHAS